MDDTPASERRPLLAERTGAALDAAGAAACLADAAHEMRGPAGAILALGDLLLARDLDATDRHVVDLIRFAGRQLTALADRLEAGPDAAAATILADVAPAETVRAVAALHAPHFAAAGVGLSVDLDAALPATMRTDATALTQVLGNLVGNALKHAASAVTLSARRTGGQVTFAVTDDGAGLGAPPARPDPVTGRDGSGRGLAIAGRLAEAMGGTLALEPGAAGGTVARLSLPAGAPGAGTARPGRRMRLGALRRRMRRLTGADAPDLTGRSVLVVDDSLVGRMLMMTILESFDMRVVAVASATEAAAEVRRRRPDVICTDWALHGETGADVRRRVAEAIDEPPPILVVTGAGTAQRLKTAGPTDLPVLRKPFSPRELHAALALAVLGPGAASHTG